MLSDMSKPQETKNTEYIKTPCFLVDLRLWRYISFAIVFRRVDIVCPFIFQFFKFNAGALSFICQDGCGKMWVCSHLTALPRHFSLDTTKEIKHG